MDLPNPTNDKPLEPSVNGSAPAVNPDQTPVQPATLNPTDTEAVAGTPVAPTQSDTTGVPESTAEDNIVLSGSGVSPDEAGNALSMPTPMSTPAPSVPEESVQEAAPEDTANSGNVDNDVPSSAPVAADDKPKAGPFESTVDSTTAGPVDEPAASTSTGLPPMTEEPAEPPQTSNQQQADFSPKFEEAKGSTLDNNPIASAGAFAATTAAAKNQPTAATDNPSISSTSNPVSANSAAQAAHQPEHSHSKKLLVLIATLIGLILAIGVIYIYLTSNKSAEPIPGTPSSSLPNSAQSIMADMNQSEKDLASFDNDFAEADLSDSALGL